MFFMLSTGEGKTGGNNAQGESETKTDKLYVGGKVLPAPPHIFITLVPKEYEVRRCFV